MAHYHHHHSLHQQLMAQITLPSQQEHFIMEQKVTNSLAMPSILWWIVSTCSSRSASLFQVDFSLSLHLLILSYIFWDSFLSLPLISSETCFSGTISCGSPVIIYFSFLWSWKTLCRFLHELETDIAPFPSKQKKIFCCLIGILKKSEFYRNTPAFGSSLMEAALKSWLQDAQYRKYFPSSVLTRCVSHSSHFWFCSELSSSLSSFTVCFVVARRSGTGSVNRPG